MTEYTAAQFQAPPQIDRLQRNALIVGVIGIAAAVAGYATNPEQFFKSYLLAFIYVARVPARLARPDDDPSPLGRRLGHADPAHLRGVGAHAAVSGRAVRAGALGMHHIFEWTHLDVVAKDPILTPEAAVPERAVLLRPLLHLLRGLVGPRLHALGLVASPGPRVHAGIGAQVPDAERTGADPPRAVRHLRVGRLDHVARSALVLDHLRPALPDPARAGGAELRHPDADDARQDASRWRP